MDVVVREVIAAGPLPPVPDVRLTRLLAERRARFAEAAGADGEAALRFPVLAALVPVATNRGGEIAYPGDPMCLYSALISTIRRSVGRRESGLAARPHVDDLYPDWGHYPDLAYRRAQSGPRAGLAADNPTTDGKVFDPRVWDAEAREAFSAQLVALRPKVLLLSAVSAAHRYALEMAETAKRLVPGCLVVLGGRHADETVRVDKRSGLVQLSWSSTAQVQLDGRHERVVDFVVSGDGAPLLDLLMQAVGLVCDPGFGPTDVDAVMDSLRLLANSRADLEGVGVVVGFGAREVDVQPLRGRSLGRAELPSPYDAFAIRARFGVFERAGSSPHGSRTAHMMTLDACPFKCTFCSESSAVKSLPTRFAITESQEVALRVQRLVDWGAEAMFFDDPVFWGGNWNAIADFCRDLKELADRPCEDPESAAHGHRSVRDLEWGAQLTVDVVLNRAKWDEVGAGLDLMREAGCTYVYIGIESMAEQVMKHVKKNLLRRNPEPWVGKVREALEKIRSHGIRVGSSVLFGLDGEDRGTIAETIEQIGALIDDGLLIMASPNILTYHPGTGISAEHGQDELDYHSRKENKPPYTFFEEAYPDVVSKLLTEDDIWYIHDSAAKRWGSVRNSAIEESGAA
ncbi:MULTISPECIES: B12-binding domain-containing radical SAM protein [Actinosynnema]|uniref:B12-binding domain-containing radical SAM protein n=1 Tax=Actinosynnema TaxID=40566 RepID=UPI000AC838D5|nr:radical SAM protein [Actinosynnema pretiosum]